MTERIFLPHIVDSAQLKLLLALPAHERIRLMLDARELAVGLIRGRLRKKYPHLSVEKLNMKVLDELERAR